MTNVGGPWHFAVVDADPSENPADLTEDRSPHTFISEPNPDEQLPGTAATFVYRSPDGWTASGLIAETDRGPAVQRLTIDPGESGDSVTAKMLRGVPLTDIISTAASSAPVLQAVARARRSVDQDERGTRRPGRAPLSDALLRQVAELYLEETAPGKPRGAVGRVADRMGKDSNTLSRWVHQARRRGWLGPAVPGREGGTPGPLLLGLGAAGTAVVDAVERSGGELEVHDGDAAPGRGE